jgi:hypothetical protein
MRSRKTETAEEIARDVVKHGLTGDPVVVQASHVLTNSEVFDFPSAQPKDDVPQMAPWARRLVETAFLKSDEIEEAARRLRGEISLGERRTDYGSVIEALDRAEENTRLAFQLAITIKAERDLYEKSATVIEGEMREKAKYDLEASSELAKKSGGKPKAITNDDVVAKMATLFRDEWEGLSGDRRKFELTVRFYDHQVEVWASRCRTLQTIATKLR